MNEKELDKKSIVFRKKLNTKPKLIIEYGLSLVFIFLILFLFLSNKIYSNQTILKRNQISNINYYYENKTPMCSIEIKENITNKKLHSYINDTIYFNYVNQNINHAGLLTSLNKSKTSLKVILKHYPFNKDEQTLLNISVKNSLLQNILNNFF